MGQDLNTGAALRTPVLPLADASMPDGELHAAHTLIQLSGNHARFSLFSQLDNRGPFHTPQSGRKLFSEIDHPQSSRSVLSIKRPRQI